MEKIMIVNLKRVLEKPVTKRQRVSVDTLRAIVARHAKADVSAVKIDNELLQELFKHGGHKPLHKIKVKIVTDDKGTVLALPPEKKFEKIKESKPAEKKEPKAAEAKTAKAEEKAPEKEQPKPKFEQKNVEQSKPKYGEKTAQLK